MWRDRTNLYISYRQSYSHHPAKRSKPSNGLSDNNAFSANPSEERRGLMSAGAYEDSPSGDIVIEMDLLPPRWLDIQDEIAQTLSNIQAQTKRLDSLHQKHILPGFEDESVKRREEREIENLTREITSGFGSCQRAIKRIDTLSKGDSQAEAAMARNLKISLATKVGDVSTGFRKKQSAYLKKLQRINGFTTPLDRASTPLQNTSVQSSLLDSESDRLTSQSALTQAQAQVSGIQNETILQREREIESIAQGVIDLANIFQELQTMVIDQGSLLDRIDYNVERTVADVKGADKELTVATGYQRRSLKRKVMLLLVIIIAGMMILLGLKLGSKGGSGSSGLPPPAPIPVEPIAPGDEGGVLRLLHRKSGVVGAEAVRANMRRDWRRRKRDTKYL